MTLLQVLSPGAYIAFGGLISCATFIASSEIMAWRQRRRPPPPILCEECEQRSASYAIPAILVRRSPGLSKPLVVGSVLFCWGCLQQISDQIREQERGVALLPPLPLGPAQEEPGRPRSTSS